MPQMTAIQREALAVAVNAVRDAVGAAGAMGAPGGVLYAAMMAHGCTLTQFQSLMSALVKAGQLRAETPDPRDPGVILYFLA